jgi:hypothetical protein
MMPGSLWALIALLITCALGVLCGIPTGQDTSTDPVVVVELVTR